MIGVIDDHTRLAYCELHAAENAINVSATLRRAPAWFTEQGCGPVQAVMSDNAKCYSTSFAFRDTLAELGARHILIPPYTPRWNGKIERFFGTLDTEWAHGRVWPNSTSATVPCHRSSASTTAGDHTPPPAADRPSAAFTKSAGRTARARIGHLDGSRCTVATHCSSASSCSSPLCQATASSPSGRTVSDTAPSAKCKKAGGLPELQSVERSGARVPRGADRKLTPSSALNFRGSRHGCQARRPKPVSKVPTGRLATRSLRAFEQADRRAPRPRGESRPPNRRSCLAALA